MMRYVFFLISLTTTILTGLYFDVNDGLSFRLGKFRANYLEGMTSYRGQIVCNGHDCMPSEGKKKLLLWGDSHANALGNAVRERLASKNIILIDGTAPGCVPFVTDRQVFASVSHKCLEHNKRVSRLLTEIEIDLLVVHARWSLNIYGTRFGMEFGIDRDEEQFAVTDRLDFIKDQVEKRSADAKRTLLIASIPEQMVDVPEYFASRVLIKKLFGSRYDCAKFGVAYPLWLAERWVDFGSSATYILVDPKDSFCDVEICSAIDNFCTPQYVDSNHMNSRTYLDFWIKNVEVLLD